VLEVQQATEVDDSRYQLKAARLQHVKPTTDLNEMPPASGLERPTTFAHPLVYFD
jgi:hypothetical protein